MEMGPEYVVIKKGEHGAMLLSRSGIFLVPAYPVDTVTDPTGAGDSFAGGFMGSLAAADNISDSSVRKALLNGAVVASFGVEAFSLERLKSITKNDIQNRLNELIQMTSV
jgi:sugar/nucleoside kinase (ribokinase family)